MLCPKGRVGSSPTAGTQRVLRLVNPRSSGTPPVYSGGMTDLSKGDRVSWNTSQGRTRGRIVERKTRDFTFADQKFTASADEPSFIVESEKSGDRAAHRGSALRKLKS
jgi:hypothetical protein